MTWIHPLSPNVEEPAEVLGGKAHGLVVLRRLGLPVPPGFVIGTDGCRAFLRDGHFPDGLDAELATAVAELESVTGRRLGGPDRPLVLAVRSGGAVSMPGMMSTIANLGLTTEGTAGLAAETGVPGFALDSRLRFLTGFAAAVTGVPPESLDAAARGEPRSAIAAVESLVRERTGRPVPDDAVRQLHEAVRAVFGSWNTPRARTYRELHGIPHDSGTAVVVQAMVFGNRDDRSGTGVAFSRDPATGEPGASGEVLFGRQGEDVVSGKSNTLPLSALADREPAVWAALAGALDRLEDHYRDACHVEFTFESGRLWLLQVRPGGFTGRAAVRVAVDLADAGVLDHREALLRVSPHDLRHARTPRLDVAALDVLTRGVGASPGVATGRVATASEGAARMAADGPVILVRPETSPLDMHGLAAAAGVVTARGGTTSHAAVVARAMGRPAVVGAAGLAVDAASGSVRIAGRTIAEGTLVTIDGTGGEIVTGSARTVATPSPHLDRLLEWADAISGDHTPRPDADRLEAARTRLC